VTKHHSTATPGTRAASRILGLDPGSRFTGYGCIETEGSRSRLVEHGRIACSAQAPLAERLAQLSRELQGLVDRLEPSVAVLEEPFHGANSRSLIVLAQARGALLATLGSGGVPVAEFSPASVKKTVTGNGRADKGQVIRMVGLLLGDAGALSPDAADALAVALCFAAHQGHGRAVSAASEGPRRARKRAEASGVNHSEIVTWHAQKRS
jgi:crossover junction endodeoxyribonuclease RuvC